ncbi:hypothetical protein MKK68_19975 [Methylobacterium sp. E-016]|uniref:hypothetical protein n=1 Tax=Methylobacterium sp. E-016 TaxID=2836556 RepID=UPI001FBB466D|nr:hypothetical protein [Methylobacterium sp. E-016]MCJ2077893.1 hypothetical protein [Methylobacterium sp. E-016]
MTIITKAALADELSISRARVSQYVAKGLPVRSDGKLDRSEALNWLHTNVVGLNTFEDRGVNRAGRLAAGSNPKPKRQPERRTLAPTDADMPSIRDVLVAMIDRVEAVVAFAVVAANGVPSTAYAAAAIARAEMMEAASDLAMTMGAPDGPDGPLGRVEATAYPPDWPALADLFGHPLDVDAWREAEGDLAYWQDVDPPEAPHPWREPAGV